jgi:hypothetical protein
MNNTNNVNNTTNNVNNKDKTLNMLSSDFDKLMIPIPDLIRKYPEDQQKEILEYLEQLDEHHKKTYKIAFDHLGSSFNIYKSNGFKEWKQTKIK